MKTLLDKNLSYFFIAFIIVMAICFPLFYYVMIHFYTEDIDELVEYKRDEFIRNDLKTLRLSDIETWNRYNFDLSIYPDTITIVRDKIVSEKNYSPSDDDVVEYRVLYSSIKIENKPFVMMSRTAMIESHDLLGMLTLQYCILFFILIVLLLITQWRISRKLWKPFYSTLGKIEFFNLEKGTIPQFEKTDIREFVSLNENLTKLISNNLAIYRQQKEFIENASHELQTPLAIFRSQLDILLQNTDLTEEQTTIIQSLYNTTSRLTRLNKNLLLLAKLDNKQFNEVEELDLALLLKNRFDEFQDRFETENINASLSIENPMIVKANEILVESLINNLIVNAIRHNEPNGNIIVSLSGKSFSVKNTGNKIPLDSSDKLFTRFHNKPDSRKGTGLGLAIAHQICKLHGWDIQYYFIEKMHCFEVDCN